MSTAKQTHSKAAGETKDVAIDFASALADDEQLVGVPTVEVSAPDNLTISGITISDAVIAEPGFPDAQPGQAILFFAGGGTAGTLYTLTVTVATDGGQTLVAAARLQVT